MFFLNSKSCPILIYGLGFAAFCVAWLWPGHYVPWTSFQQEVIAAIGALLVALGCLVSTGRDALKVPALSLGALLLALVPMAQWVTGKVDFFIDALLPALYLVAFALTVIAARALATREADRLILAILGTLLVGAAASTLIGLGQGFRLGWESYIEQLGANGRVFANFTQPNHLAALLCMAMVSAWWLFESRRLRGGVALLAIALLSFGAAMTQARIGIAVITFFALWWWISRKQFELRTSSWAIAGAATIFVLCYAMWPVISDWQNGSAVVSAAERVKSLGGRGLHWPVVWDAVWRQPWTGWGWMQVSAAQQAVALDHAASREWLTYSHSVILDVLVWNGVPIGLLLLAAATLWIVTRALGCKDLGSWAMLTTGGVFAVYSLVEFPYAYTFFLLPFAVFVGVLEARTSSHYSAVVTVSRPTFAAATLAMAVMLTWLTVEYFEVENMARRARFNELGFVVVESERPAVPEVMLIDSQREFIRFLLTPAKPGMSPAELAAVRQINRHFMGPPAMLRYALAMGLNGHAEEASRNLRLLCHIWSTKYCDQGRVTWTQSQQTHPPLASIPYPPKTE